MFIDEARVHVRAGRGGDGCCAFLREKFRPRGGPSGGDGGRGGSVVLVASTGRSTLLELSRQMHYRADSGQQGGNKCMTGRSAEDLVIEVPLGTLVYEVDPEDPDNPERRLLCDLTDDGQRFVAAKGGRGGRGNARFASSINQAPRECEPGGVGGERTLLLELKLLADVGLVGLPSAGKSTLISRISAARPKIAAYPFTTLSPVLGIVDLGSWRSCVVADLPGLIEGAHRGVGLGTQFLRHIERTRMLVHVIDARPLDGKDPLAAYREIRGELEQYGSGLAAKREIVALNKVDLTGSEAAIEELRAGLPGHEVLPISAVTGHGLPALRVAIARHLTELDAAEAADAAARAASGDADSGLDVGVGLP